MQNTIKNKQKTIFLLAKSFTENNGNNIITTYIDETILNLENSIKTINYDITLPACLSDRENMNLKVKINQILKGRGATFRAGYLFIQVEVYKNTSNCDSPYNFNILLEYDYYSNDKIEHLFKMLEFYIKNKPEDLSNIINKYDNHKNAVQGIEQFIKNQL